MIARQSQDRHACSARPLSTFGVQIFARQDAFPGYNVPTGRLNPRTGLSDGGPVSPASVYRSLCGFASPRARACSPAPCLRMPVAVSPLSIKLFSSCAVEHSKPRPGMPILVAAAIAGKTGSRSFCACEHFAAACGALGRDAATHGAPKCLPLGVCGPWVFVAPGCLWPLGVCTLWVFALAGAARQCGLQVPS